MRIGEATRRPKAAAGFPREGVPMSAPAQADHAVGRIAESSIFPAVLSIGAGVIHAAVVPEHLAEQWTFGVFFILVAVFQFAWAIVVVLKPSAIVFTTGALANGAILAVWALSRTIGLPIGPQAWVPEPVSTADVTATLMELLLVVSVLLASGPVHRGNHRADV
jgi:uncharacterized membrane protein YsdA (DUF1294 family)